jgi:hypothetical protein
VTALVRYQTSLLFRSHRWIPPVILYVIGVVGLGGEHLPLGTGLPGGLSWAALMLVPVVAWLTRSMLVAEPPAARACVAAAGGPRRTQVSALLAAVLVGVVIALAGVIWELINAGVLRQAGTHSIEVGSTFKAVGGGLLAALICLMVASAIGALCNPPVVRRPGPGMLTTTAAVVLAVAWNVSPANAALRTPGTGVRASSWPHGMPVLAALALVVIAWTVSAMFAARRSG